VRGVREVINEVIIDPSGSTGTFARDTWISAQLKSKILFDKEIDSINYQIETVRHVVYLMGVAQNKKELDRVINYARNLKYVERVVNHVILKTDPRRRA
jgi:osmotically-inducible protein OsmY